MRLDLAGSDRFKLLFISSCVRSVYLSFVCIDLSLKNVL